MHNQKYTQQFYKFQKELFRFLGVYHLVKDTSRRKRCIYKLYCFFPLLWSGSYVIALFIALITLPSILDKIIKCFFLFGTLLGSFLKMAYLKRYSSQYEELFGFIHDDIFTPADEFENTAFRKNLKLSTRVRDLYGWVSFLSFLYNFLLQQIIAWKELPAVVYTPLDMNSNGNWMIIKTYSFVSVGILCFMNIAFDSLCTALLIFVKAQLEILEYRLEKIGSTTSSDLAINMELKKCIQLYTKVYELVLKLEKAVSLPVSIQIFCSTSVLCSNFYALSFSSVADDTAQFLKFVLYQAAMLTQIFLTCFFANEVTLTSSRLSHAIYSANWWSWNRTNRKFMLMIMLRFRSPIIFRSANPCYIFDLAAFTSIVNTSYSYFALLKQMNS